MIYNEYIIVNIYKGNYKGISILNRTPIEVNDQKQHLSINTIKNLASLWTTKRKYTRIVVVKPEYTCVSIDNR